MSSDSVLVWMLSLNREYVQAVRPCSFSVAFNNRWRYIWFQEYDAAFELCKTCFPNDYKYDYKNPDSFRTCPYFWFWFILVVERCNPGMLMTQLLPVLMMRHRRVPRAKWRDHVTPTGKHWIEHLSVKPFAPLLWIYPDILIVRVTIVEELGSHV